MTFTIIYTSPSGVRAASYHVETHEQAVNAFQCSKLYADSTVIATVPGPSYDVKLYDNTVK